MSQNDSKQLMPPRGFIFYALFFQRKIEHKALPVVSSYISVKYSVKGTV